MEYGKKIVCLAHSRKTGGFCVAGKELTNGQPGEWVRPISPSPTHEILPAQQRCADGTDLQLLDLVYIPFLKPCPALHQSENHLIDPRIDWEKEGRIKWSSVWNWLDTPRTLWNLGSGSVAGENNRIASGQETGSSLYLVKLANLTILVGAKAPQYPDSKRSVRGEFVYNGESYRMDVTDPFIEQYYLRQADGRFDIPNPIICVSLGDLYQGYFYKLIAAVLYEARFP